MSEKDINRWHETIVPPHKRPAEWSIRSGGSWDMYDVAPIPDAMLSELMQRHHGAGAPWNCHSLPLSKDDREYMYLLYYSMIGLVARMREAEKRASTPAIAPNDDLLSGMKRRIGVALSDPDASAENIRNGLRGMQRFIIEWEQRTAAAPPKGRYAAPFQCGDTIADVQIMFVPHEHIHEKPTEANPSPVRVIRVGDLERAQPSALARGAATLRKCPTCGSPSPRMHPAVQHEGEVQTCTDPWHGPAAETGKKT